MKWVEVVLLREATTTGLKKANFSKFGWPKNMKKMIKIYQRDGHKCWNEQ